MKLMRTLNNQKGFSLVELMVVVAIIGILAVIGIPQYQKFMAKARQAEAKTHLNGIFQGETSYFTEYNSFTVSMKNIGAGAVGQQLRYDAGFAGLNACANITAAGVPAEFIGAADDSNNLHDPLVNNGIAGWAYWAPAFGETDTAAVGASICDNAPGAGAPPTFTATAWGNPTNVNGAAPNNAANNLDQFTMTNNRLLTYSSVGL